MGNLARRPQGNDRAQVKAIYEGVCDIAIINNYYFGKLKYSDKAAQKKWASAVRLIFPNQGDRGTHVNISGGGVAKHSKNVDEAVRFLEFLTSKPAQKLYGRINFEYPANPNVAMSKELRSWGRSRKIRCRSPASRNSPRRLRRSSTRSAGRRGRRFLHRSSCRRIETDPSGCAGFCRHECIAISVVVACQHDACPTLRACALALLDLPDVDPIVTREATAVESSPRDCELYGRAFRLFLSCTNCGKT